MDFGYLYFHQIRDNKYNIKYNNFRQIREIRLFRRYWEKPSAGNFQSQLAVGQGFSQEGRKRRISRISRKS